MEHKSRLQQVTDKLLERVEAVLDEGKPELSELKQLAAVLKDLRDVYKEAPESRDSTLRVVLEGEVAAYAQ